MFTIILGKAAIIEFFLTAMPQKQMTGINVLAAGIDNTDIIQRSDTIIVIHIGKNGRIGVISIPRDTRVKVDGVGMTKINHAYAYGKMPLLQKTVANFLNLSIPYYIKLDLKGLETIIDQVGGITLNIDKNMYYVDHAGDVYIDFKQGEHQLSGKEAISYLRYRKDLEGDIARIKRQQGFLRVAFNRVIDSKDLLRAPALFHQLNNNFESNLSMQELIGLAVQVNRANRSGEVTTGTVPGEPVLINGVSYWQPNIVDLDKLIDNVLLGFEGREAKDTHVETIDKTASQEVRRKVTMNELNRVQANVVETPKVSKNKIMHQMTIEILNGNGRHGIAQVVSRFLKDQGFKISWFGNAGSYDYAKTLIVAWKGDVQNVLVLANILHIDPSQVIIYNKPEKKIDATIVVGKDWDEIWQKVSTSKKQNTAQPKEENEKK